MGEVPRRVLEEGVHLADRTLRRIVKKTSSPELAIDRDLTAYGDRGFSRYLRRAFLA
jgi:hypothetical protein